MMRKKKYTKVFKKLTKDFNNNYIEEIKNFISSCEKKEKVMTSLNEGIHTMDLIIAAKKSQISGKLENVEN